MALLSRATCTRQPTLMLSPPTNPGYKMTEAIVRTILSQPQPPAHCSAHRKVYSGLRTTTLACLRMFNSLCMCVESRFASWSSHGMRPMILSLSWWLPSHSSYSLPRKVLVSLRRLSRIMLLEVKSKYGSWKEMDFELSACGLAQSHPA